MNFGKIEFSPRHQSVWEDQCDWSCMKCNRNRSDWTILEKTKKSFRVLDSSECRESAEEQSLDPQSPRNDYVISVKRRVDVPCQVTIE